MCTFVQEERDALRAVETSLRADVRELTSSETKLKSETEMLKGKLQECSSELSDARNNISGCVGFCVTDDTSQFGTNPVSHDTQRNLS
jgi:hypothetical protein